MKTITALSIIFALSTSGFAIAQHSSMGNMDMKDGSMDTKDPSMKEKGTEMKGKGMEKSMDIKSDAKASSASSSSAGSRKNK